MEEQKVVVHGSHEEYVKIIDKSRRAYSFSLDSTRAFTSSLKRPRKTCGDRCTRFRAFFYSLWLMLFKHHGKAPGKSGLYTIFFAFAFLVALDLCLLMAMLGHIFGPMRNVKTIGVTFLLTYPFVAIFAPFCGVAGCITGWPSLLKSQSGMNAACVLVNYPATIIM